MAPKVFIDQDNQATFICPECGTAKQVDVKQFKSHKRAIRIRCTCTCGHQFPVVLEHRKQARKQAHLSGSFSNRRGVHGNLRVIDVSQSGLKLEFDFFPKLELGDRLRVIFILDDAKGSRVEKDVIVRNLTKPFAGVEFLDKNHYGAFGAYLLYR